MHRINSDTRRSRIVASSSFLPTNIVSNEELTRYYGGLSQRLFDLLGIEKRRWVFWPTVWLPESFDYTGREINRKALDDYLHSTEDQVRLAQLIVDAPDTAMQYLAAQKLLTQTDYPSHSIGKLYSITSTPDNRSSRSGQLLSYWLGLNVPAISAVGGCAEVLKQMIQADAHIRAHDYNAILIVASQMTSKQVSETIFNAQKETGKPYVPEHPDRIDAALFGDGSAAILMVGEDGDPQEKGIFARLEKTHGDIPLATYPNRRPMEDEYDVVTWRLNTKDIRNIAPRYLTEGMIEFLKTNNLTPRNVGRLLLHPGSDTVFNQAVTTMSESYGLPESEIIRMTPRMYKTTGNLSNSGIPLLINTYWEELERDPRPHILGAVGGGSDVALVGVRF